MPPLVEIYWKDHYSIGDDWHPANAKHEHCILSCVGYIVAEDDIYYWVASTYEPATGCYSSGTAVLKNCIVDMHSLKKKRRHDW